VCGAANGLPRDLSEGTMRCIKGAATFQKLGVPIFPSCPYIRPITTAIKFVDGMGIGRGVPIPSQLCGLRARRKLPYGVWVGAPAPNDFGVFRVQFCAIFCALTSAWKWKIRTTFYWLVGLMFPFNYFLECPDNHNTHSGCANALH